MIKRRLLVLLLALLAAFGAPGLARAQGGNTAIAINTQDGSDLFKLAFAIRHVMSDVVDEQNAAVAYAQCTSCETTAIAIEIVLVEGSPSTISPTNVAVAVNQGCTLCDTFATAYQFVLMTGGPVRFTEEGLRELHAIRAEIRSWGKQGLSNEEIRARLPDVIARIKNVLATQLVPAGEPQADESDTTEDQGRAPPASSTPTATTESGSVTTTTPTTTTDTTATTTQPTPTTTDTTTSTTP